MDDRQKKILEKIKKIAKLKIQLKQAEEDENFDLADKLNDELNKLRGIQKVKEEEIFTPKEKKEKKPKKEKKEKEEREPNEWILFLNKYRKDNPHLTYRQAQKKASEAYDKRPQANTDPKYGIKNSKLIKEFIKQKALMKVSQKKMTDIKRGKEYVDKHTNLYNISKAKAEDILQKLKPIMKDPEYIRLRKLHDRLNKQGLELDKKTAELKKKMNTDPEYLRLFKLHEKLNKQGIELDKKTAMLKKKISMKNDSKPKVNNELKKIKQISNKLDVKLDSSCKQIFEEYFKQKKNSLI